jgi:hypothetical protein
VARGRGDLEYHPSYGGPPDPETTELIPALAAINRHAFVTDDSQPGVPLGDGWAQRAYLDGYCDESTAWMICNGLHGSELIVIAFPPMTAGQGQIVVTLNDDGEENTWCGIYDWTGYLYVYDEVSPELSALVASSWSLQIIDPKWGRNELLWSSVLTALEEGSDGAC